MLFSWTVWFPEDIKIRDAYQMLKKQGAPRSLPRLPSRPWFLLAVLCVQRWAPRWSAETEARGDREGQAVPCGGRPSLRPVSAAGRLPLAVRRWPRPRSRCAQYSAGHPGASGVFAALLSLVGGRHLVPGSGGAAGHPAAPRL